MHLLAGLKRISVSSGRAAGVSLCVSALAVAQAPDVARTRPDFSGSWSLVRDDIIRAPGAKDPLSMFTFGPTVTIHQTSATLQIAIWKVRLDGVVTSNPDGSTVSARWDGSALVLSEREPSPEGSPAEHRVELRLAADGMLTIDLTSTPVLDVRRVHSIYRRATGVSTAGADGVFAPGPGITSPVLTHEEKAAYTDEARRAGIQGLVRLDVTVRPDGTVDPATVNVTQSLDRRYGLDARAIAAAKRWRFTPAVQQSTGRTVPCRVSIVMTFKAGG